MSMILKIVSFVGLGLTVVPAFLVFAEKVTWNTHALLMMIGTLVWFLAAPMWMKKED